MRSGYILAALLLLLLTLGGTQLVFADSVTLTIKPGQAANVTVYLNPGDGVRFSFTVTSWRGTDEIGFTIVSTSGSVVLNRGRVNEYTGNYTATSGGTYYLTFDNSFSTITSKTVNVNYYVTPAPTPVPGQGFMYGSRTDKGQYDLGEVIHITVYRGSVTDLCIYHVARCEVYYLGNLVASYGPWNDSVVSPFPLTVDFTPTQAGVYTIIVRYWCNGVNECTGSACQVPVNVNVIPELLSVTVTTTEIQTVTVTTLPFGIPTTLPFGIPGFPVESVVSGLLIGLLAVMLLRKRQKKKTLRPS